jgi:hypothetical protein
MRGRRALDADPRQGPSCGRASCRPSPAQICTHTRPTACTGSYTAPRRWLPPWGCPRPACGGRYLGPLTVPCHCQSHLGMRRVTHVRCLASAPRLTEAHLTMAGAAGISAPFHTCILATGESHGDARSIRTAPRAGTCAAVEAKGPVSPPPRLIVFSLLDCGCSPRVRSALPQPMGYVVHQRRGGPLQRSVHTSSTTPPTALRPSSPMRASTRRCDARERWHNTERAVCLQQQGNFRHTYKHRSPFPVPQQKISRNREGPCLTG